MTSDLPTGSPPPVAPHRHAVGRLGPLAPVLIVALLACPRLPELPADGVVLDLADGEQRAWRVALDAGQALRVRAAPEDGDVELRLLDPAGQDAARAQGLREHGEAEELLVVAIRSGIHRVELHARTAVRCRMAVDGPRAAGPEDPARAAAAQAAQRLFDGLREEAPEEARRAAIAGVDLVLARWRQFGDVGREAALLYARGSARYAESDWDLAAADFLGAAQRAGTAGDEMLRADALNEAGRAVRKQDRFREAVVLYEQALDLYRQHDKRALAAATLSNLAMTRLDLGEARAAQRNLGESLSLARASGSKETEVRSQLNLCSVLNALGDREKELACHAKALDLARHIGDPAMEGVALNNLGTFYELLGEWDRALQLYRQALGIARGTDNIEREARTLSNLGKLHQLCGRLPRAVACYRKALELGGEDGSLSARTLGHLSRLRLQLGAPRAAATLARQALEHTAGRPKDEAMARQALGEALRSLGEPAAARAELEQALALSRQRREITREASVSLSLARLARGQGDFAAALAQADAAIELVESERARVPSPDLRASYFGSKQDYHQFKVDTLMELDRREPAAGHAAAALQANEQARARSLLEVLSEAGAKPRRGLDPQLLKRERRINEEVNIPALQRARSAPAADALLDAALEESRQVQAELRASSPRYADLTEGKPLRLAEIQRRVVDAETVLLEYALGEERSYLWAVTAGELQAWQLPPRGRIEAIAALLYRQLTARNEDVKGESSADRDRREKQADAALAHTAALLSEMVLRPAAAVLRPGRRVAVVADGALQYVPFAVLPTPHRAAGAAGPPLIAEHEVVALPSASVLASIRRDFEEHRPPAGALAVLADPVFSPRDRRMRGLKVSQLVPGLGARPATRGGPAPFPRLPSSRQEARAIADLARGHGEVFQALGFDANLAAVLSGRLVGFRRIHFATHGVLDSRRPDQSSLVLSLVDKQGRPREGHLRLRYIYDMELNADLVVLSACDTALGKEVRGEGLIGLTRGFMHAGAPRVVASLWKVEDKATKELMTLFYQGMLREGLRPAAALRQAQLQLAEKDGWRSPYFWGAFSLQGEWR